MGARSSFRSQPFPDRIRELKTWISADTGPTATIDALLSVAPYFKLSKTHAKIILTEVDRPVGRWRVEGRSLGMTETELEPFLPAFEHAEREAARQG